MKVVDNNDEIILATLPSPVHSDALENGSEANHLFVYPAESNFSGRKFPLSWENKYHNYSGSSRGRWFVLLDASAYVSTNSLDLSQHPFDYVALSFHKMFGYPTGLGALLVRNSA